MKFRWFLVLLSLLTLSSGCLHKSKPPQPEIAADVENAFKQRWIAKRMAELQASGMADGREARRQATEEFRKKYEYINSSRGADPLGAPTP